MLHQREKKKEVNIVITEKQWVSIFYLLFIINPDSNFNVCSTESTIIN